MIDAQIAGCKLCGKCGRPMDRYNTYVHEATGKEYCRGCHRDRQQRYRDSRKGGPAEIALDMPDVVTESSVTVTAGT